MKKAVSHLMNAIIIPAAFVASTALVATPASAAVLFQGSTKACFGSGCSLITAAATGSAIVDDYLTYNSNGLTGGLVFNQYADNTGYLPVGGSSDSFGWFNLGTTVDSNYAGDSFTLQINFVQPGNSSTTLYATLIGSVIAGPGGGLTVDFDNNPVSLTSSTGQMFTLVVDDTRVAAGAERAYVTGVLQAVPEPKSWAMMLLGFFGIGAALKRGRKPALAQLA